MIELFENSVYYMEFGILDLNPSTCSINIDTDIDLIHITPESLTKYKIETDLLNELKDELFGKLTIMITNDYGISNIYEDYIVVKRKVYSAYGRTKVTKNKIRDFVNKEESLWRDILFKSKYQTCSYDDFINSGSISSSHEVIYNSSNSFYSGDNDSYIVDAIVSESSSFEEFMVHVEKDSDLDVTIEYAINNSGVWHVITPDKEFTLSTPFNILNIKVTWLGKGNVYGIGVYYNKESIDVPIIDKIEFDRNTHFIGEYYEMQIYAHDPNDLDLSYEVVCDYQRVNIVQNSVEPHKFNINYPLHSKTKTIDYFILVTNSNNISTLRTKRVYLNSQKGAVITGITWDNDDHYEQNTYTLKIEISNV